MACFITIIYTGEEMALVSGVYRVYFFSYYFINIFAIYLGLGIKFTGSIK